MKGEEKQSADTDKPVTGTASTAVVPDGLSKSVPRINATTTPKKRKRTEDEIAQRKAKKLKKKGKESQEWNQLSEDRRKQLADEQANENGKEISAEVILESTDGSKSVHSPALLSRKAKEIAKAQREEKVHERQKQSKATQKQSKGSGGSDEKANQVLEYLDEYQAHINSGAEWKFKKQHQNWIVKHLYAYPWKNDEVVIGYLKSVQGKARQRLIDEAEQMVRETGEDKKEDSEEIVRRAVGIIQALGA